MGKQYNSLTENQIKFIEEQKMFFVATAGPEGKINLSPKGMDSFRVIGPNQVIWLNVTGSGNETAAHVALNPRMTIMFNAFDGKPEILRLYGNAVAVHHNDEKWSHFISYFPENRASRQIFDVEIEMVQSSCGFGVPLYEYQGERSLLDSWADKKSDEELLEYWETKNKVSLDGLDTGIVEGNLPVD